MSEHIKVTTGTWFPPGSKQGRTFTAFVETVEDLRRRSAVTATDYDIVQAAGLVRRLILDGKAVALGVGAELAVGPTFEWARGVVVAEMPDGQSVRIAGPHFDTGLAITASPNGDEAHEGSLRSGGVEELLAWPLIEYRHDPDLTVRDVLRWAAHHRGGVHWDMAHQTDAEAVARLDALDRYYPEQMRWTVLSIVRVVYRGLEPLVYVALAKTLRTIRGD